MYRVHYKLFVEDELVGEAVSRKCFVRKGNAERWARIWLVNSETLRYEWTVEED